MSALGYTPGRFPALRSRDFRLFWVGQFISRTGSHMQNTAINWHLYLLTGSPVALGMLGLVRLLPVVLLSLVGGALADAVERRRLLIVTQCLLMINAALLGWLTLQGRISPTAIYVMTIVNAGAMAFDNPARQSLVVNLVPREHLANALSLSQAFFQVASLLGPLVAGLLIDQGGIALTYWLNSASFIAVLVALALLRPPKRDEESASVNLAALREGLLFVRHQPVVWGMMLLDAIATFFSSANALLPIFAKDILKAGARGYGLLSAAPAAGSILAAAGLSFFSGIQRQGIAVLVAVAIHGLATVAFGLSRILVLSCFLLAVANGADTISSIMRQTIRQLVTPDRLRGRVTAVNMVFYMGGPRLGELEAGLVAGWLGAPLSVITGGIGCLLTVAVVAHKNSALRTYTLKEGKADSASDR